MEINPTTKKVATAAGIAAGAAAIGSVVVAARKGKINFAEVKDVFKKTTKEVDGEQVAVKFGEKVRALGGKLVEGYKEIGRGITKKFVDAKDWVVSKFSKAKDTAEEVVEDVVE